MPTNEKTIYVYDSFTFDEPKLLGKLFVNTIKGGESYSFEHDKEWLSSTNYPVSIDPDFMGYGGREYPSGRSIFGIFADASPDRWGRILMTKKERRLADKEARKPRKLNDSDFLMGVYDENPIPYGDELSLNVNEDDNHISIPLALETAYRFGIKEEDAMKMAKEIAETVKTNWEKLAIKYGIPRGLIEDMRPAFSACYE